VPAAAAAIAFESVLHAATELAWDDIPRPRSAGAAAIVGFPFFGALLATLLAGSAAAETAPIAILSR
jgi:hypothetical protein